MLDFSQLNLEDMYEDYMSGAWTENEFSAWSQIQASEEYQQVTDFINSDMGVRLGLEILYDCWFDCWYIYHNETLNDSEMEEISIMNGLLDKVVERVQNRGYMLSLANKMANEVDFKEELIRYYKF